MTTREEIIKNGLIRARGKYKRVRYPDGRLGYVHRKIWEDEHGKIPNGYVIDHINGNKCDNRLENLRMIPHSENIWLNYNYHLNKKTKKSIALGRLVAPGVRRKTTWKET